MRKIPVYLTALCLTIGASAAFAGTAPKVQQKTTPQTTQTTKPAPATPKAGAHHHRHHHKAPRPSTKKS
jgi:hypothetical protein